MTKGMSRLHRILEDRYVAFAGSVTSIGTVLWAGYAAIKPEGAKAAIFISAGVLAVVFAMISIYSIKVRQTNKRLTDAFGVLHRVNHEYRDALACTFSDEVAAIDFESHAREVELETLRSVCQKAAKIFMSITHADCTVTVKFIFREDGKVHCQTHTRSEENCLRDTPFPLKFAVRTGENSAFDTALAFSPSRTSHFFCADMDEMAEHGEYRNQRDNWRDFYRTAIIVPIRRVDPRKVGQEGASDDIGFLCVDSPSPHRLNNKYHLQLLAALADQMYNFMSLMRGKYRVPVKLAASDRQSAPQPVAGAPATSN